MHTVQAVLSGIDASFESKLAVVSAVKPGLVRVFGSVAHFTDATLLPRLKGLFPVATLAAVRPQAK